MNCSVLEVVSIIINSAFLAVNFVLFAAWVSIATSILIGLIFPDKADNGWGDKNLRNQKVSLVRMTIMLVIFILSWWVTNMFI